MPAPMPAPKPPGSRPVPKLAPTPSRASAVPPPAPPKRPPIASTASDANDRASRYSVRFAPSARASSTSSSRIACTVSGDRTTAPSAECRRSANVSSGSNRSSSITGTDTVFSVSPGENVNWPSVSR